MSSDNREALKTMIRSVVAFFAAVVGFGLKHLLDPVAGTGAAAIEFNSNRWLCFIITGVFSIRILAGASVHMIREHASDDTDERKIRYHLSFDIACLLLFGLCILYASYAASLWQFIMRSVLAALATVGSSIVLTCRSKQSARRWQFFVILDLAYLAALGICGLLYIELPGVVLGGANAAILLLFCAGLILAGLDIREQITTVIYKAL